MDAKSISQKRAALEPVAKSQSGSGSVRHYQRSGRAESNYSNRTNNSDISLFLYNNEPRSVFNSKLMALGERDPMQANKKWNNYVNAFQQHLRDKAIKHGKTVDQIFAKEVEQRLKQQLAKEKKEQEEKLQAYRQAVNDQSKGYHERKHAERMLKKMEDQRFKQDNDAEAQRYFANQAERKAFQKKNYMSGLEKQKSDARRRKQDEANLDHELNAKNRNYLIDDQWKRKNEAQLKDHLKGALVNQMEDKNQRRQWDRQRHLAEQEQYRDDLQRAVDRDIQLRKEIDQAKKDIFQNEIKNQQMEGQKQRAIEAQIDAQENEKVRQKLLNDHLRALDNEKRKNEILKNHNAKVGQQIANLEARKRQAAIDAKIAYQTGLVTQGDKAKYFDYLDCQVFLKKFGKKSKKKKNGVAQ